MAEELLRRSVLAEFGSNARNIFCRLADLSNEASVEDYFASRLIQALGYQDGQIKPKHSLDALAVGRGRRRENYKPDYALLYGGVPRCIVEAKGTDEDLDRWIEQCSGYCLALNRKFGQGNPVRYFLLSNAIKTILYEWDKDNPVLILDFSWISRNSPQATQNTSI